ncbi:MAG TPA: polymer-forming cytoskeletal protein [Phycisphaerae bacterium]|nr:polymer-forming cytoskeletal protein [Phycisphaerae bacterium]
MADNGDFPTIIGADARFKGELSFERGVRIDGAFDGHIKSKGSLHVAEGAKVSANVEASNVKVEGDCRGNFIVSEKLHLMATAKVEGDLRTTRLEIADGAIFSGNVVVGQTAMEAPVRRMAPSEVSANSSPDVARMPSHPPASAPAPRPTPRPQEIRIPAAS